MGHYQDMKILTSGAELYQFESRNDMMDIAKDLQLFDGTIRKVLLEGI